MVHFAECSLSAAGKRTCWLQKGCKPGLSSMGLDCSSGAFPASAVPESRVLEGASLPIPFVVINGSTVDEFL